MGKKILMVCLGNICRSPLAEGILKSKLPEMFMVDSAGTIGYHEGNSPDPRSITEAKYHHLDISNQKSRPITLEDLDYFDFIFCMDKQNLKDVLQLTKNDNQRNKISLLLSHDPTTNREEVPDPYHAGISDFSKVFDILDSACDHIVKKILHP